MTITQLQPFQGCKFVLRLNDGEVLTGEIKFVDVEYEDVVVDIPETTCPGRYKGPTSSVYAVKATDVASVEKVSAQPDAPDE